MSVKNMRGNLSIEDKKMLDKIYWRSFFQMAGRCGGQVRLHATGFIYTVAPALNRYHKDKESHRKAMMRHTSFFNITQTVSTFCMGLVVAMEKEAAEDETFDTNSIIAVKTSLMGPMSAIGDSMFWGVLRLLAASVCIPLAEQGAWFAPLLFLAIYNIPGMLLRYYLLYAGYTMGSSFLKNLQQSGAIGILTKGASILGLIMGGAMIASNVTFATTLTIPVQGSEPVAVQTYLDTIFKGLVPISISLVCLWAQKVKHINVNWITLFVFVFSILLSVFHIV